MAIILMAFGEIGGVRKRDQNKPFSYIYSKYKNFHFGT